MPEFKPSRPREERSRDGGDRGGDRGRDGGAADRIRHDIDLKTGLPTDPISQVWQLYVCLSSLLPEFFIVRIYFLVLGLFEKKSASILQ